MRIIDQSNYIYEPIKEGDFYTISRKQIPAYTKYIEVQCDEWSAEIGEQGHYVLGDVEKHGSYLCYFTQKAEEELLLRQSLLPLFGVKNKFGCILFVAVGMKSTFHVKVGLSGSRYYIAARFELDEDAPYEDISFQLVKLDQNADYSDMAKYYRNFQLARGICTPLKKRAANNEQLSYAVDSVEIRIRMGWKPAPSPVKEQTPENEPEMKVACTFDRVKDIIDELKQQGVDKAQLCLVGWNIRGHDGRWPQMFPVEEKLGGEQKLRELITYAQKNGYQIVCHTNSMDSYRIAEDFSEDIVIKRKDGSLSCEESGWSGGRPYHLCPQKAWEFAKRDLPRVADLGFKGIHYIDVMTVVPLRKCYDINHPVTEGDTHRLFADMAMDCKRLFGGYASEGAFDFAAGYLDYAFYVTFGGYNGTFFDKEIPLWPMVYHGIILSNPSTVTTNYTIKDPSCYLRLAEFGGRPAFYIHSKFLSDHQANWLGKEDIITDTDQDIREGVTAIKTAYDEYKKCRHLQYEFLDHHQEIEPGVCVLTYSDGTKVTVNHNTSKVTMQTVSQ